MKFADFGFQAGKILGKAYKLSRLEGQVPAGRSRLTRTRKGQGFKALRLADEIYPYQLAADPLRRGSATNVGPLKKGGSSKSKKSLGDIGKM